jgi:hypothetical protein
MKITMIGNVRQNKLEILNELKTWKGREMFLSGF